MYYAAGKTHQFCPFLIEGGVTGGYGLSVWVECMRMAI